MRDVLSILSTSEIVGAIGSSVEPGDDLALMLEFSEGMLTGPVASFHDLVEVHFFCQAALAHLASSYPHHMHTEHDNLSQRLRMKCYDLDDVLEWHMWRREVLPSALERAREEWEFISTSEHDETQVIFEVSPNHWLDLVNPVLTHFKVADWVRNGRPVLCAPAWFHSLLSARIETPVKHKPYLFAQGPMTGTYSRPVCSDAVPAPAEPAALDLMKSGGLQGYSLPELLEIVAAVYR